MERYRASLSQERVEAALSKAQDHVFDAWERRTSRGRIALAWKALALSPLCADAYGLLAAEASSPADARDLYMRGVAAGEIGLGPAGFRDYDGEFWGYLETRPYMRARHGLALALIELGDETAALAHFRAMLDLNPGDNQGIRYLLLAALLRRGDVAACEALIEAYADEWSVQWLYTRALLAYRAGQAGESATLTLVAEAREANPHVAAMMSGSGPKVHDADGFVIVGGPDEASNYVLEFGQAWRDTPGAVAWLVSICGGVSANGRTSKRPARKAKP